MLSDPTLKPLGQLGLSGMAEAFAEIEASSKVARFTHPKWLGLLIEREVSHRCERRLAIQGAAFSTAPCSRRCEAATSSPPTTI